MPQKKYIPNALAILIVLGYYLAGQYLNMTNTSSIFKEVDLLTSNIILVIVAITIGLFITQYWIVFLLSITVLLGSWVLPELAPLMNSTQNQITASVLVILGFSSIAHFSRNYRSAER
jgi:hypothetical protein